VPAPTWLGLDEQRSRCEDHAQAVLALQAPVAHDLRLVLAVVYSAEKIERMGDLAAHIADATRLAHPAYAVPADLMPPFAELGMLTAGMADRVADLITTAAKGRSPAP
jgi:phosphate transport system protein